MGEICINSSALTKYSVVGALLSMLFMVSCGHKESKQATQPPIQVSVLTIDTAQGAMMRTYVGAVEANEVVALSFPTGGKVEKVLVREGDAVRAGQKLAIVNKTTAQNTYNSAKAQLSQAEDAYNRLKKVYDQGSLAEVKWVEICTALEKARSLEQIARKQLEDCALIAPISGVVGECRTTAGSSSLPGEPIVTLMDVNRVFVTFSVPESEIATVTEGAEVRVEIPALGDDLLIGRVSERSMTASKVSHSYDVKVLLQNRDHKLLPGMVCKVYFCQPENQGVVVPAKCVQVRPEGKSVWVVHHGRAEHRLVQSSEFVANGVRISSGLHFGDTVITEGVQKLYNGAQVTVK